MNNCTTHYYASLSDAVSDINSSSTAGALTDSTTAKAELITSCTGTITVRALADDILSSTIAIQKDLTLELEDKTLSFTGDGCLELVEGTDITICGGTLQRTISSDATKLYLIQTAGKLKLDGTVCQISGYHPSGFLTIKATSTCTLLDISSATVSAINSDEETDTLVKAIQTQAAKTIIVQTTVTAEAANSSDSILGTGSITVNSSTISAHSRNSSSRCIYSLSGNLKINGSTFTAGSEGLNVRTVYIADGTATIDGSTINASSDIDHAHAIYLAGGTVTVDSCIISAVTSGEQNVAAQGIYVNSGATARVKNTQITTDANYYNDTTERRSVAVDNWGTTTLEDVTAIASYTAVWNGGKIYVNGGTYSGYTYGGFVFDHGTNGEAFINDALLRGGDYVGSFDYAGNGYTTSAMYIIGAYTQVYMDNCAFDASKTHRSIVIRGTPGETHNSLYISNSTVEDGTLDQGAIRIDNDTMMLYVGIGNNITSDSLKNGFTSHDENGGVTQYYADYEEEGVVEYTGKSYRRYPADHICTGEDMEATTAWISSIEEKAVCQPMSVEIITSEPQDTITQSFLRPDNGLIRICLYVPPVSEGSVTSKAIFKIGDATIFEGFLMSDPSNCGSAIVEFQLSKNLPCIPFHYYTHGAGLADLHASGIIPGSTADNVTISAPSGATFPVGTSLHITAIEH